MSGATPAGIDSAADLPKITQSLLDRGYSAEDIHKILGGNLLRVFRGVRAADRRPAEAPLRLRKRQDARRCAEDGDAGATASAFQVPGGCNNGKGHPMSEYPYVRAGRQAEVASCIARLRGTREDAEPHRAHPESVGSPRRRGLPTQARCQGAGDRGISRSYPKRISFILLLWASL